MVARARCWPRSGSSGSSCGGGRSRAPPWAEQARLLADEIDAAGRSVLLGSGAHPRALDDRPGPSNEVRAQRRRPPRPRAVHRGSPGRERGGGGAPPGRGPGHAPRGAASAAPATETWPPPSWPRRSSASGAGSATPPPEPAPHRNARRPSTYAAGVPAEIQPVELARVVDFAERSRVGDWSLRSALVRYAEGQPERVSQVLEQVRRLDAALHPLQQGAGEARGRAVAHPRWRRRRPPDDALLIELLRVAVELDQLGDAMAAWADDRTGPDPTTPSMPPPPTAAAAARRPRRAAGGAAAAAVGARWLIRHTPSDPSVSANR